MEKESGALSDNARFLLAKERAAAGAGQGGIGTLAEKNLHRVLKYYIEPDDTKHEVPFAGSVADVKNDDGIFEIQTGDFANLRQKLAKFLETCHVTVVYPVVAGTRVHWTDPGSGEVTVRRSPKHRTEAAVFRELYPIRAFLSHPGFSLRLILLSLDDYRTLDGWDQSGKRGATKGEKIPTAILSETGLSSPGDYRRFLDGLPSPFTVREFSARHKLSDRTAAEGVRILSDLGLVRREGKRGRAYLYTVL